MEPVQICTGLMNQVTGWNAMQYLLQAAGAQPVNEIKIEAAENEEPVGRGQKRKRKGKDKPSQPVKSYTTRERAKAEAEVVAEVSASCFRHVIQQLRDLQPKHNFVDLHGPISMFLGLFPVR